MNRGMIELTDSEVTVILSQVPETPANQLLRQKLTAAAQDTDPKTKLECSEEELEVMIDVLPAPHETEEKQLMELRPKLTQNLSDLRTKKQIKPAPLLSKLNPLSWFK